MDIILIMWIRKPSLQTLARLRIMEYNSVKRCSGNIMANKVGAKLDIIAEC